MSDALPPVTPDPSHGASQSPKPPFDRQRFVFQTLAVVICTQLLIYSLAAGVCGQRALAGRPVGQICPGTLEHCRAALIRPSTSCWRSRGSSHFKGDAGLLIITV